MLHAELKPNSIVIHHPSREELVVAKEQNVVVGSTVETANGRIYKVSFIEESGKVHVKSRFSK